MRKAILGACGLMVAVSAISAQQPATAPPPDLGLVDAARQQDARVRALLDRRPT